MSFSLKLFPLSKHQLLLALYKTKGKEEINLVYMFNPTISILHKKNIIIVMWHVITGFEYSGFIFNIFHYLSQIRIFRIEFQIQNIQKYDHIFLLKNPDRTKPSDEAYFW